MKGLSSLKIGLSSESDAIAEVPGLRVDQSTTDESPCSKAERCLALQIITPRISLWVLEHLVRTGHPAMYSGSHFLGFRIQDFEASVSVRSGVVSHLNYRLMLSTPEPAYPGVIVVGVSSTNGFRGLRGGYLADESPDYMVSFAGHFPGLSVGVAFTHDAPADVLQHAFDLRLRCASSLTGCRRVDQLLPAAVQDGLRIEQAARQRMQGPYPCPDRILPRRVRDSDDILLVQVSSVRNAPIDEVDGAKIRVADFHLLQVLKGEQRVPLQSVEIPSNMSWGGFEMRKSASDLFTAGRRLLIFPAPNRLVSYPCDVVEATPSALQTIRNSLSQQDTNRVAQRCHKIAPHVSAGKTSGTCESPLQGRHYQNRRARTPVAPSAVPDPKNKKAA